MRRHHSRSVRNWEEDLDWVEGKTCIVTGSAGSLGLASVRALIAGGAKVMLVGLEAYKLKHLDGGYCA
jgi:NAD(P)-dependent dehydrogenase (short-subunit alcohol dehydrogenase family)